MAANVDLWIEFDGSYHSTLSIPVPDCQRFSIHPLRWLRYLGFTIYGTEGHSPHYLVAQRSTIPKIPYRLVIITM